MGDKRIDGLFVVRSDDEARVRPLLENERLRRQLLAHPAIHPKIRGLGLLERVLLERVIYAAEDAVIQSAQRLKSLYDLLAETLSQLQAIGSASR